MENVPQASQGHLREPPSLQVAPPSRSQYAAVSAASAVSVGGGLAGAAISDEPILDLVLLACVIIGLVAGLLLALSANRHRRYVALLFHSGALALEKYPGRIPAIISELRLAGADREADELIARQSTLNGVQ